MSGPLAFLLQKLGRNWAMRRLRGRQAIPPAKTLRELLNAARDTRYGKAFGFEDVLAARDCYDAFRRIVPVIDYDDWVAWLGDGGPLGPHGALPLRDQAWAGAIDVFCLSSGTTSGRTKFIPYSAEMAAVNRAAAFDFFAHIVADAPHLMPPSRQYLYMSGSTNIQRNAHGALCGDMSGLTKYLTPRLLEWVTLPPRAISGLEPWNKRLEALVELCLHRPRIGIFSGIPIWQLALLEAIGESVGKSAAHVLPNLELLIHGGMSIEPYRRKIEAILGPKVRFLEVYAASEIGIGAFQIPGEPGMRFQQDYRVFYEFEDASGTVVTSEDVVPARPYRLIVSSCAGLWRYRIGDVLVFREKEPLVLDYVTRDKTTSAFDEKITEKEVERAVEAMSPGFADFSMGPDVQTRRHVWFFITAELPGADWLVRLDDILRRNNQDYDDYREDGRIGDPVMVAVASRSEYLKILGRAEGGQRKFPRLLAPAEVSHLLAHFSETS